MNLGATRLRMVGPSSNPPVLSPKTAGMPSLRAEWPRSRGIVEHHREVECPPGPVGFGHRVTVADAAPAAPARAEGQPVSHSLPAARGVVCSFPPPAHRERRRHERAGCGPRTGSSPSPADSLARSECPAIRRGQHRPVSRTRLECGPYNLPVWRGRCRPGRAERMSRMRSGRLGERGKTDPPASGCV